MVCSELDSLLKSTLLQEQNSHLIINCNAMGMENSNKMINDL